MKRITFKKIILFAGLLAATSAHADDKYNVSGFGYQDYRKTNANILEGVDKRGTGEIDIIAFVVSAKVTDHDTVFAQLESSATEPTRFTWAFLDHRFNDNLSAHIGRVKFPLGLYNEFIDNKWLQLGVVNPLVYAAGSDMVHDAYTGVGLDWTAGSLFTQVYAGHVYDNPQNDTQDVVPFSNRNMYGGRITWNAPFEGLRLLVSAYRTQIESTANNPAAYIPGQGKMGTESRSIVSLDYVSDSFDIKAEHSSHKVDAMPAVTTINYTYSGDPVNASAWYVQGGYKIGLWTPYVRIDKYTADKNNTSSPSLYQNDQTIGVGYKINDNINARIEYQLIKGYALTDNIPLKIPAQTGWKQIAAGINFIF